MKKAEIILYGSADAQDRAQMLLQAHYGICENSPIKNHAQRNLHLLTEVKETSLIPLLRSSGIQGFRLVDQNQRSSRKASLFSL